MSAWVQVMRWVTGLLFCGNLLLTHAVACAEEPQKTVRIALSAASPPTSYLENGEIKGLFKEILEVLFSRAAGYQPVFYALPWPRAQRSVQSGEMDVFCTFPSVSRKDYADFLSDSLFIWDHGNLVYDLGNPHKDQIEKAQSFDDLRSHIFVSQQSVEWENENVPRAIARYVVNKPEALLHVTFMRKAGDFFIMSPEQAVYYAKHLGYEKQLGMKKVSFIPNSQIHFHIGVRKTFPGKIKLMTALEAGMKAPEFLAQKKAIEAKYKGFLLKN